MLCHVFQFLLKSFKRRSISLPNPLPLSLSVRHLLFLHYHQRQDGKDGKYKIEDPDYAQSVVVCLNGWDFILRFKSLDGRG